ncbi:phytanoyl-CoA dioxygenase family protein [Robbsia sp. Bb-Pol-6]|uniref:Phytanoyl-CoA dioxygenase family protein n=1 Tax=Robbsia betulipollinis TaxID=2981849 RepID=A0ABT3ZRH2_9BURK|nr:phytanoyl-CoA dioxygenase family protein [Robbsia betulipollinis]MCY0389017.1 phytanoyl-CoA dioxygenase family protein [Robbsia betulipollinis]
MAKNSYLNFFKKNGFLSSLPALNSQEVEQLLKNYQDLCGGCGKILLGEKRLFGHLKYAWVQKVVTHDKILEKVEKLIGENIFVWISEFNTKPSNSEKFFSWHQDAFYWNFKNLDEENFIPVVTAWIALTPSNKTNGCLKFIPGSHKKMLPHIETKSKENLLTRGQTIKEALEDSKTFYAQLNPGEFSLHHPLICHASDANISADDRVGLVVRYLAPEVIPPVQPAYAWLVRGEDRHGNWNDVFLDEEDNDLLVHRCIDSVKSFTGSDFK